MENLRPARGPYRAALLILCIALLLGCDVSLETSTKPKEAEVLSVSLDQGATLKQGETFEIYVALPEPDAATSPTDSTEGTTVEPSESAYSVEVRLETSAGGFITSQRFPYNDGDMLAPIQLDDLGLDSQGYRLVVRLMHGDEEMASETVEFTYLGDEYELKEITSDAPSIHPGSTVTLTAVLSVPEDSEPYMEWSWSGGVFARGSLREGLDTVQWTSPPFEGIYTITASLYPLGAGSASVPLSADIYVSVVEDPLGELGPPESYRGLYHLLGDLEDSSPELASGSFLDEEEPLLLVTRGRVVGYRLDGTGGISFPAFLLPVHEGTLDPFTVSFGFTPGAPTDTARPEPRGDAGSPSSVVEPEAVGDPPAAPTQAMLFRTAAADGSLELTLALTETSLVAELRSAGATNRLEADASSLKPGMRSALSFSVSTAPVIPPGAAEDATSLPEGALPATLTATWFLDGREVGTAEWIAETALSAADGLTTVGGSGSARGLLDELGVYVRDEQGRAATDPGVFGRAVAEEYRAGTVADGFDGMYLPAAYAVTGSVGVAGGDLVLGAGSTLRLPAYGLDPSGCRIKLTLTEALGPAALLTLSWGNAEPLDGSILALSGSGELREGETVALCAFSASPDLVFSLKPGEGTLGVEIEGLTHEGAAVTFSVPLVGGKDAAVILGLANGLGAETPVLVDSLSFRPLQ